MNSAGAAWTDIDRPVAAADPVICRTSRFCTVSCIQVPALDRKFAADHQRMLRCRSDRHGEREGFWRGARAGSGVGKGGAGVMDTVRYSATRSRGRGPAENWTPATLHGRSTESVTARTIVADGTAESMPPHAPQPP